ncbi:hypothetical protein [Adhaeribacter aquaticus]|uniref:hypothetical protein n=1 Tax=Adhaeribacter aquaticus TaxID=299567 RepID=UPI000404E4E4|nr:hypothetical protein [Adhaeribacter aquaticus]
MDWPFSRRIQRRVESNSFPARFALGDAEANGVGLRLFLIHIRLNRKMAGAFSPVVYRLGDWRVNLSVDFGKDA